jgi:hypothetical protein
MVIKDFRARHMGVFQVPSIFICHPLVVYEDLTDVASLSSDGGLVTTELLKAYPSPRTSQERISADDQ